ncbi:MAG: hypothetical protein GF418_00055 [Chitinivibrionales bacterium]|nr:hypothetical protein [Chitinivibrionales bacterium]MBD3393992.1 hypothetical protein [Chitinivibrionales bacterium]
MHMVRRAVPPIHASAVVLLVIALCLSLRARERIDGIVAFVGDSAILYSELEAYTLMKTGGLADSTVDSAGASALRRQALDDLIDGKVLLVQAEKDTNITISENEIDAELDNRIQGILRQNNLTLEQFETVLQTQQGLSIAKFKAEVRKQIRQELIKQKVQQQYVAMGGAAKSDIEEFYREYRDSLPPAGESVLLRALIVEVAPSDEIRQKAYERITAIKERLDNGEDFSEVAKRYSEGPNAHKGGDLGFISKGTLSQLAFEERVFSMEPGDVSDIIRTRIGFHIATVLARREDMVHVKQVFVAVKPPQEQYEQTRALLDSLRTHATTAAQFEEAARRFSTDEISRSRGGMLRWQTVASLAPAVRRAIDALEVNGISEVVTSDNTLAIYRLEDRVDSRALTLDDDWNEIATIAQRVIAQEKLLDLVRKWRQETFIDIRL